MCPQHGTSALQEGYVYNLMYSKDLKPYYTSTERPFMLQMNGNIGVL